MRLIFKSLWNRRKYNVWLFVELILVTVLAWRLIDATVVSLYEVNLPQGYDPDRLVKLDMVSMPSYSDGYKGEYDSIDANNDAMKSIMEKIRSYSDVEYASNFCGEAGLPGGLSATNGSFNIGRPDIDTLALSMGVMMMVYPGEYAFETYGLKAAEGSPSAEELSKMVLLQPYSCVITKAIAEKCWPGENAVGKKFVSQNYETGDTVWGDIVGVVDNMRWSNLMRTNTLVFTNYPYALRPKAYRKFTVAVRLREGVDADEFIHEFSSWAKTELRVGNFYLKSAIPYRKYLRASEESYGVVMERNLNYVLTTFFLLSLILGTIGCFWLQTRRRVEEIGIRRSFGARRGHIVGMLLGESLVMASVAFLIGIFIYLQWALKHGLNNGFENNNGRLMIQTWVDNFPLHFTVISAIVFAVIITGVIIGTLIPAINASRVNITDALRDE